MKSLSFFLPLFLLHTTIAQVTGEINYDKLGISFQIPEGWAGQESQDMLILGSNTVSGMVIMTTHTYDKSELISEAKKGIYEDNGTALNLNGDLLIKDNLVAGVFNGTLEWQPAKSYIMGVVNPYGIGVSIMAITTPDQYGSAHQTVCENIYRSIVFSKVDRNAELKEWKNWLSDSRLTYMNSHYSSDYSSGGISSGYSSERKIDLCAQGYFTDSSSSDMTISGSGVSGYGSDSDAGSGTWKIELGRDGNFALVLTYSNGEVYTYSMAYEDQKFYLNGTRYFVTSEGEYAPNCN